MPSSGLSAQLHNITYTHKHVHTNTFFLNFKIMSSCMHPFSCKWHNFILYSWKKIHFAYWPYFLYHPSVFGYLPWIYDFTLVTGAAINTDQQVSLWCADLYLLGEYLEGVTGHTVVPFFSFMRNHHTDLHSGWTCLHFSQLWALFQSCLSWPPTERLSRHCLL